MFFNSIVNCFFRNKIPKTIADKTNMFSKAEKRNKGLLDSQIKGLKNALNKATGEA